MTDLHPPPRPATDIFGDPLDSSPPWFNAVAFTLPDFDCESYISDLRSFVPVDSLRAELRTHLAVLNAQLVDHLNRDYADFVALSTRLVDVDAAVARMRDPVVELRGRVAGVRGELASTLGEVEEGLRQRAEAAEARAVLELLLDAFHVVSKIEKLIKELPSTPTDWSNGDTMTSENRSSSHVVSSQNIENGTNIRETQSILLERIASEMNRLKFYTSQAEDLPFIKNMEKRIQNASSLLDCNLRSCFSTGLEHRDANAIYNCLRAYAAIENTMAAEEIFRTTIVSPLVQKIISEDSSNIEGNTSNELEDGYKQIIDCIERDCKFLLDVSSSANSGLHVFDFLGNSILKEVLRAIQKYKPGALSPGRPTEFLRNYKSSLTFLDYLEGLYPSRSSVAKFRSEAVYADFIKLWNIGVYISLRFQEIAGALDSALTSITITPVEDVSHKQNNYHGLTLKQSDALLCSLKSCWREDVLVFSCSDKFLRLCLQLLSRYSSWLSSGLAARRVHDTGSSPAPGTEWATTASPEDFIYIMHDVDFLVNELSGNYLKDVIQLLTSCSDEVRNLVKQSVLQAIASMRDLMPPVLETMIEAVVEKSVGDLRQLRGITATYRMSNKPPTRHSPYVSGLLRPLRIFLDGERIRYLTNDAKSQLLNGAVERITKRYHDQASELMITLRKAESSLLRLRQSAERRTGVKSDISDNNLTDIDRFCMQLFLDIQEYGRNLSALGVSPANIPSYQLLWKSFAPPEKETEISF